MALKEADVLVRLPGNAVRTLCDASPVDEIGVIQSRHRNLWRMYVFVPEINDKKIATAGNVCSEVLGIPNRYFRKDEANGIEIVDRFGQGLFF